MTSPHFTKFSASRVGAHGARLRRVLWLAVLACAALACGGADEDPLARRGRVVYETYCIACHASDPALAGAIGPPLAGSSLALLEAKVLRNAYPPGYAPQRESNAMAPFPHLEAELQALHAYLLQERAHESE